MGAVGNFGMTATGIYWIESEENWNWDVVEGSWKFGQVLNEKKTIQIKL